MKIAIKITVSFLVAAIILTVISCALVLKIAEDTLKQEIVAHLETTARSREDHIETYLEFIKVATAQLSNSPTLEKFLQTPKNDPRWDEIFKLTMNRLKRTREVNPAIYEFLLLDVSGKIVASSNPASIGQDRSADTLFTEGLKKPYIKSPYFSDIYKIPLIAVSAPVIDYETGKSIGVLASRNTLVDLDNIATDTTGLGKTGEIYVVNRNGYMITPSRFLKDTFLKMKIETDGYKMCMRRGIESETSLKTITYLDYRKVPVLGTSAYITEIGWALIAEIDISEAFAPLQRLRIAIIVLLILIPVVVWFVGKTIAGRITEPLHRLHEGTEVIAEGDLDHKVGTPAQDEVGQLSRAFDTMTSELRKKIVSIHDLNNEVAERKKAEEAAEKAAGEWLTTFDSMAEGVSLHGLDHTILNANKTLCTMLGKSKEELIGKKCYQVFHGTDTPLNGCPMEKARLTSKDERSELFEPYLGRWLAVSTSPVYDKYGKPVNFVHVIADITEQKKMHDQLAQSETMAALGRFSAGAAHEIKNPLGIILGGMEYLRAKYRDADEESKETMGMVSNAVLRVDSIINALTELAGPSEHRVRRVDAKTVVEDAALLLKSRFKDKPINFSAITAESGLIIEADIDQVQYVLLSILMNAADAMPGGGDVRTRVFKDSPARPSRGGPKCVIEIADTGEGISEDALPKIFEPFFTTRRDRKQVGLGLTVAKEFIALNKGDISITSKKGEGTVVKISFPIAA